MLALLAQHRHQKLSVVILEWAEVEAIGKTGWGFLQHWKPDAHARNVRDQAWKP